MLSAIAAATIGMTNQAPIITSQPPNQTIFAGQNATFSVTATGTPAPVYQWLRNAQGISGATSPTYTRSNAQAGDAGTYTVTVSNSVGVVGSSNAVLTVQTNIVPPGSIIIDNTNSNFAITGTWTVGTSSADKYGSSYDFATTVTGNTTATATFTPNIITAGDYDVSVWYPEGSNRTTNAPWSIVGGNGTTNVNVNQQINGGQWLRIATNIVFNAGNGGYVRVANNAGPSVVVANAVQFSYSSLQPPFITVQPQSQSGRIGSAVTFSVRAAAYGASSFSYQWAFNGTNASGGTGMAYAVSNLQSSSAGSYSVTVSDPVGYVISLPAVLTVDAPVIFFNSISLLPNGQIHLQVEGDPVNIVLQTSTNLSNWVQFGSGSLSNGPADFYDTITNTTRFYRARTSP
jgi:hypothetical protein